jgi:hypothetical protein
MERSLLQQVLFMREARGAAHEPSKQSEPRWPAEAWSTQSTAGPGLPAAGRRRAQASGRIGGVQRMHRGALGSDGYGFLIQDDDGKSRLALCYKTQEEADDAAAHADQMLANTIFLTGMGDETHSA